MCARAATELSLCEQHAADALQQLHVLPSGFHGVDAGGVHAGVAEDVRKPQKILFHAIKNAGEQMPQRMGKGPLRGSTPARGVDKAGVFLAGELPFLAPEQRPLDAQGLHAAVGAAGKGQVAVDPHQHGVDAGGLVSLCQSFLVADGQLLGGLTPIQSGQEGAGVAQVLFYRGGAFLVFT